VAVAVEEGTYDAEELGERLRHASIALSKCSSSSFVGSDIQFLRTT